MLQPLFEFSGACSGCGETPYIKLMTQLFGDRVMIANATGCSSIYGGNLPTTPYCINAEGRGPAWSNSLFEDNAEFGLGMRLAVDKQNEYARELVWRLGFQHRRGTGAGHPECRPEDRTGHLRPARARRRPSRRSSPRVDTPEARDLLSVADTLVKKSVWIVGGDGWAYDIGYGGLDHVLASRPQRQRPGARYRSLLQHRRAGVQSHPARRRGQVRRRRQAGRQEGPRHDGHELRQRLRGPRRHGRRRHADRQGILEAEAYDGPSLIIAYSHCIAHGYDLAHGMDQQKAAVNSGYWPLFRYNPDLVAQGKNPFQLDSRPPSIRLKDYIYNETRYTMLVKSNPEDAKSCSSWRRKMSPPSGSSTNYMAHETGATP